MSVSLDAQNAPANVLPAPIELHGSDLLKKLTDRDTPVADADRVRVLEAVVNIVNTHRLRVFRSTYLNRSEIAAKMPPDAMLYGLNFLGLLWSLGTELEDCLILPVMDGVPACAPSRESPPRINKTLLRAFDRSVRWIHNARCHPRMAESISIENAHNLAEPVFADSAHSTLLQLADLVSYLLLQREREELAPAPAPASEFRREVLRVSGQLPHRLVRAWRGKLTAVGKAE